MARIEPSGALVLTRATDAAAEPVSTAEAKTHLRVDHTDDDTYIDTLVSSARQWLEEEYGVAMINQTWTLKLRDWPDGDGEIWLPRYPLSSVTSIAYVDEDGTTQTWASSNYSVDTDSRPGRVRLAYDKNWPGTRDQGDAITVTYVAGYGAAATDVPDPMVAAVKLLLAHLYRNREPEITGTVIARFQMAVDALMAPYSTRWF